MNQSFARTPFSLVARLALAALLITAWLGPALPDVAEAQAAPLIAQADGACGDKPCEDIKPDQGACGATPCEDIKPANNPCGDRPCGEIPVTEGACGAVPCEDKPVTQGACGDQPCGEASNADVNQAPAGDPNAAAPGTPGAPGASATTVAGKAGDSNNSEAAKGIDAENTSSGGSNLVIPLLIVVLAGLALFWVVRRNRANADNEV